MLSAFSTSGVAYAADGAANETNTEVKFSDDDLIKLIATYCAFGLSIIVGIPLIKTVNKRKKQGYVNSLAEETEYVAKQVRALYESRDKEKSKREVLKFSIKVTAVADHALTTYTEKQIQVITNCTKACPTSTQNFLRLKESRKTRKSTTRNFCLSSTPPKASRKRRNSLNKMQKSLKGTTND